MNFAFQLLRWGNRKIITVAQMLFSTVNFPCVCRHRLVVVWSSLPKTPFRSTSNPHSSPYPAPPLLVPVGKIVAFASCSRWEEIMYLQFPT